MADEVEFLRDSEQRLTRQYDVALLDLDGVVYIGAAPVVNAVDASARARADGMRLAFVTNNAARPPAAVAEHLTELGIAGRAGRRDHLGPGRRPLPGRPVAGRLRTSWSSGRPA